MSIKSAALIVPSAILLGTVLLGAAAPKPTPTKTIMHSLYEPLAAVLPLSFDDEAFADPKNKAKISKQLSELARNAKHLAEHAKSQDRAFEFVALSLARDARDLDRRFAQGNIDEAQFTLHNITHNCIACHSSLPETTSFPAAERLLSGVNAKVLSPFERAHFQIVGRQFDAALDTLEAELKNRKLDVGITTSMGEFADYLKVAISVKGDLKRPQALISEWMSRPNVPLHVRMQLEKWLASLKDFETRDVLSQATVPAARLVLEDGRKLMQFPRDRDGLVHYVVAEAMLSRFVHGQADRGPLVAEAYYLLGNATAMTEHSFWLVRSDFYLESAIRMAPAAAFAPKAFAQLVESYNIGYTGSRGTKLPDDVVALLKELRQIVEQAHGKS